jgi:hypothetical protein
LGIHFIARSGFQPAIVRAAFGEKVRTMFERLYATDFTVLYPLTIILIERAN